MSGMRNTDSKEILDYLKRMGGVTGGGVGFSFTIHRIHAALPHISLKSIGATVTNLQRTKDDRLPCVACTLRNRGKKGTPSTFLVIRDLDEYAYYENRPDRPITRARKGKPRPERLLPPQLQLAPPMTFDFAAALNQLPAPEISTPTEDPVTNTPASEPADPTVYPAPVCLMVPLIGETPELQAMNAIEHIVARCGLSLDQRRRVGSWADLRFMDTRS